MTPLVLGLYFAWDFIPATNRAEFRCSIACIQAVKMALEEGYDLERIKLEQVGRFDFCTAMS